MGRRYDAIVKAWQHVESFQIFLDREQFERTEEKVAGWLEWFTHNGPSPEDRSPEAVRLRNKLERASEEVTRIKQQIDTIEINSNVSLQKRFNSYEGKAKEIDELVLEVIAHNPKVSSYYEVLRTLREQAENTKKSIMDKISSSQQKETHVEVSESVLTGFYGQKRSHPG